MNRFWNNPTVGLARNNARKIGMAGLPLFAATVAMNTTPGFGILTGTVCSAIAILAHNKPRPQPTAGRQLYRTDTYIMTNLSPLVGAEATHPCALFVIEIDDFEKWTTQHGQSSAKAVIRETYDRLVSVLRHDDIVLHSSKNQFYAAITLGGLFDVSTFVGIARRLQRAIDPAFQINETPFYFSVSIGLADSNQPVIKTAHDLRRAARVALTWAQKQGSGQIRIFAPHMHQAPKVAANPSSPEIAQALKNGEITAFFQPQICSYSSQVIGLEALARWVKPDGTIVPPAEFLPILENAGLMQQATKYILRYALQSLGHWQKLDLGIKTVSVNLCNDDLANPKIVDQIRWELKRSKQPAETLRLEIIEDVLVTGKGDIVSKNIADLAKLGCRMDLDDFGTGHASIPSLRHLKLHRLKIDRSFVTKCDRDPGQKRILSAMISMARELEMQIVAEGVETISEQCEVVRQGVDAIQGYAIARPMAAQEIPDWIQKYNTITNRLNKSA